MYRYIKYEYIIRIVDGKWLSRVATIKYMKCLDILIVCKFKNKIKSFITIQIV